MKEELKKLQGTWNIVAFELDGRKMPAVGSKIVVKGNRFTTIAMGATYDGTLAVDVTKTPKTFDLIFTAGPEKGNTSFGIYELDGDTWKICLAITGKDRPKKFATKPGSGHALETLKRERRADSQHSGESEKRTQRPHDAGNVHPEPAVELEGEWSMLKLCFSTPGQKRPTDFATTPGDARTVTVWRLVKK